MQKPRRLKIKIGTAFINLKNITGWKNGQRVEELRFKLYFCSTSVIKHPEHGEKMKKHINPLHASPTQHLTVPYATAQPQF